MRLAKKSFVFVIVPLIVAAMGYVTPCLAQEEDIFLDDVLTTTIDIKPETLNLKSKGKWVTCFVEAPEGYAVEDILSETVLISDVGGNTTNIEPQWYKATDNDEDGESELMLKYLRSDLIGAIGDFTGQVEVVITGFLFDDTPFVGSDTVRVKIPKK